MMEIIILILSATFSIIIFDKLNYKYKLCRGIRDEIGKLNEKKEHKLRIISYVLIIIIYAIMQSSNMITIIQGLVFGLLLSFREACFENNSNQ